MNSAIVCPRDLCPLNREPLSGINRGGMSGAHTPILLLADCSHHTRLNHLEQVDLGTESLVEVLKKGHTEGEER